jgi:hypothetical protein
MITKKGLKKIVRPHWEIPDELLDEMAGLPDFNINYVKQAARSHSCRYERFHYPTVARALREAAKRQCDLMMNGEYRLDVFAGGQILEYNMVADALEKIAEDNRDQKDFPRVEFGD